MILTYTVILTRLLVMRKSKSAGDEEVLGRVRRVNHSIDDERNVHEDKKLHHVWLALEKVAPLSHFRAVLGISVPSRKCTSPSPP